MKRFNLFWIIFALVCGCHIIGVQSNGRSDDIYLEPIEVCKGKPTAAVPQEVVQIIPGLETCGAIDTTLNIATYKSITEDSIDECQKKCQSDNECAYAEYNKKTKACSFTGKDSFGTRTNNVVTGFGECPTIGQCPYFRTDYLGGNYRGGKPGIYSLRACQAYCRSKYGRTTLINYGIDGGKCGCKQGLSFGLAKLKGWISGPTRCPHCFGYKTDLSKLPNVYNGSPNPSLKEDTVEACQKSCKKNRRCLWFQFKPGTGECLHKNPLTARMVKCNAAYASRYCDKIKDCAACNPNGVIKGDRSCGLLGNCLFCNKQKGYTGIDCNTCLPTYYMHRRQCKSCDCDSSGSKSQLCTPTGDYNFPRQCPCKPRYTSWNCQFCASAYRYIKGICCARNNEYNLNGRCVDCGCDPRGSNGRACTSWNNNGKCYCKYHYKGRDCSEVSEETASWKGGKLGDTYRATFGKYFMVLKFICYTFDCDLRFVGVKSFGKDVDMWGSTGKWSESGGSFTTSGTKFCKGYGISKQEESCPVKGGLKGVDRFFLLVFSSKNFFNSEFRYKLGDYVSVRKCNGFKC